MIYLSAWMYDAVDQGTWNFIANSTFVRNGRAGNYTTHNDGDAVSFKAYMPAGTYTCKLLSDMGTNRGIAKIKIDGTTVFTQDLYDAVGANNQIFTQAAIAIAASGVKVIQYVVDGKNAASTDHIIWLQEIVFYRTA